MTSLKSIIEQHDSFAGRAFDYFIQFLILVSLISFSVETLPDLAPETRRLLRFIELTTVAIFTVEYVLRIVTSDSKARYILSFYGLVDLLAILPFYITSGLDLRAIRILRLLRLVRAFKLVRYSKAIQLFRSAFSIAKEELVLFFVAALMLLYLSAVGIYYFENEAQPEVFSSVFSSLWWAVVTLTTVGYGDAYPITAGGRVFTFAVLLIGLGVVAVPSGIVASALSKARELAAEELKPGPQSESHDKQP